MMNWVFHVKDGDEVFIKLVLNAARDTIAIFSAVDEDGTPYSVPEKTSCGADTDISCGNARNEHSAGMGVRIVN